MTNLHFVHLQASVLGNQLHEDNMVSGRCKCHFSSARQLMPDLVNRNPCSSSPPHRGHFLTLLILEPLVCLPVAVQI
jgi:hypothetical protein